MKTALIVIALAGCGAGVGFKEGAPCVAGPTGLRIECADDFSAIACGTGPDGGIGQYAIECLGGCVNDACNQNGNRVGDMCFPVAGFVCSASISMRCELANHGDFGKLINLTCRDCCR